MLSLYRRHFSFKVKVFSEVKREEVDKRENGVQKRLWGVMFYLLLSKTNMWWDRSLSQHAYQQKLNSLILSFRFCNNKFQTWVSKAEKSAYVGYQQPLILCDASSTRTLRSTATSTILQIRLCFLCQTLCNFLSSLHIGKGFMWNTNEALHI